MSQKTVDTNSCDEEAASDVSSICSYNGFSLHQQVPAPLGLPIQNLVCLASLDCPSTCDMSLQGIGCRIAWISGNSDCMQCHTSEMQWQIGNLAGL